MGRRKASEEVFEDGDKVPRNAANTRERTRMRVLSKAFGRLKLTLPWVPPDTKLSKLDTLRLAMSYINHLQKTLEEDDDNEMEKKETTVAVKNKVCHSNRLLIHTILLSSVQVGNLALYSLIPTLTQPPTL